jgi:hypothetical protein
MPMTPKPARTIGGITGKAQSNVSKVYQQMEQEKKKAAMPSQKMPYKPNSAPSPAQKMPYTPPKDGSGPRAKTMPFKPESPKKKPADRMKPTAPGKMAPKKNRSAFEDNRMQ